MLITNLHLFFMVSLLNSELLIYYLNVSKTTTSTTTRVEIINGLYQRSGFTPSSG